MSYWPQVEADLICYPKHPEMPLYRFGLSLKICCLRRRFFFWYCFGSFKKLLIQVTECCNIAFWRHFTVTLVFTHFFAFASSNRPSRELHDLVRDDFNNIIKDINLFKTTLDTNLTK
jgi:hypothetical protein